MSLLTHPRARQRLLLVYAGIIAVAGAMLCCALPQQRAGIVVMGAVGLAAAWTIAQVGSHRIRRRLHSLREATDALGEGHLLEHIDHLPNDDFTKLAESVDRIAGQLRELVAEQDRLRQRLSRSEKLAVIGELAATVAHEVNNPLDGLQNSINILRRNPGNSPQIRKLLDMMEAGLSRIEVTVRRLLSMSRDEPIHPVPTRVDEIVEEAVMFVQPRLNRYGIQLVFDFSPEPVLALADHVHMAQVLINLMINAADAMRDRGGTLTVRCRAGGGDRSGVVRVEVADTGTGIEPQHLPRIFEPFYSTKGKGAGTGLGLAVVARIIEAHHGRIEVQTKPGEGTCFLIELPAAGLPQIIAPVTMPSATVLRPVESRVS